MKSFLRMVIAGAVTGAALFVLRASQPVAQTGDEQTMLEADHALVQVLGQGVRASRHDNFALNELLDDDFTWIRSNGESLTKPQALKDFRKPANAGVAVQVRSYGRSALVRANSGNIHVLRVWVKRASGWRVILYQEVAMVAKSEPAPAADSRVCENPCKTIPFQPDTPSEREAISSWQGVMRAMAENDGEAYSLLIADEFTATDTHHDWRYTKADRISQIRTQKRSGNRSVPPALLSARMFDFGETVMMIAREQRANAKAYFNTRMWVKREGRWQMLFSFNTRIE